MRAFRLMVGLMAFHTWFSVNRQNALAGLSLLYIPMVIGAVVSVFWWPPAQIVGIIALCVSCLFLIHENTNG